jgi:hypothetical protein
MEYFQEIVRLLEKIPASFWGVAFGSVISIIGINATNRASDKRLVRQFANDREQKTKEREMTLRKEIYMDASEALSAGLVCISKFANLHIADDEITKEYLEKVPSIAKVHVIAKIETIEAIANFTSELGLVFLKLANTRFALIKEKNEIDSLIPQIDAVEKETNRLYDMLKSENENNEGTVNKIKWDALKSNWLFEQKKLIELAEKRASLSELFLPKQIDFMRECFSYAAPLQKLHLPILVAIRSELEFDFNELKYQTIIEDGINKQIDALGGFMNDIKNKALN